MKIAATHAIAEMAKKPVPEAVNLAYNITNLKFGRDYIIPKPMDQRLITEVSMAVAKAALIRVWPARLLPIGMLMPKS
jgi:malate dehydrogenase (oxaloacetate-decarboxylating)(NADP+)